MTKLQEIASSVDLVVVIVVPVAFGCVMHDQKFNQCNKYLYREEFRM